VSPFVSENFWGSGIAYEHSSCRHLATQGALRRSAGRQSVATKVTRTRPVGDASYFIQAQWVMAHQLLLLLLLPLLSLAQGKPPADTSPVAQLLVALQEVHEDVAQVVRLGRCAVLRAGPPCAAPLARLPVCGAVWRGTARLRAHAAQFCTAVALGQRGAPGEDSTHPPTPSARQARHMNHVRVGPTSDSWYCGCCYCCCCCLVHSLAPSPAALPSAAAVQPGLFQQHLHVTHLTLRPAPLICWAPCVAHFDSGHLALDTFVLGTLFCAPHVGHLTSGTLTLRTLHWTI